MTTAEKRRQVKVSNTWIRLHPEYSPNEPDAVAMHDVVVLNNLDWTVAALEIAHQILLLKGWEFRKRKTVEDVLDELIYAQNPYIGVGWVRKEDEGDLKIYEVRIQKNK